MTRKAGKYTATPKKARVAAKATAKPPQTIEVQRVQTGVRLEKRILKVLKALADLKEITLGDLIEGIVLHAFEGKAPFGVETLHQVETLKKVFKLDLDASSSHRLRDDSKNR